MWKPAQSTVVAIAVMAGLLSGVACQSHMVVEAGSVPSHHATPEHTHEHEGTTPSHHGTPQEGHTPEDPCCVLQVADAKNLNAMVLLPEAIEVTATATTVEEPALRLIDAGQALTHKPPGNRSLLDQTCVLLI